MYKVKFVLTIQIALMTAIMYTDTVDTRKLHVVYNGKIEPLATVAKSKPILLATC